MQTRVTQTYHWPLLFITLAILIIGLVNLFSAAFASRPSYFFSQLAWVGISIVCAFVVYLIDYRIFERTAYILYGIGIVLLLLVFFSRPIAGSNRWIILGALRFQPSELFKIILVISMARYFHRAIVPVDGFSIMTLRKVLLLLAVPMVLILREPDLGTSLLLAAIAFTLILFVKINTRTVLILVLLALISAPIAWNYVLKDYQKKRIQTLFDPGSDPRGTGYHRRQSIIAIGSGGLGGKGFREGTQTQLRFLPEQHTDFIFSVWAEEQGFLGGFCLIGLYLALILSGIHIAGKAREKFGALLAVGVTSIIFWQVLINIGMVIGLLPVVGVTLPMMSYGGTSLLTTMVCIGLLFNIYARRHLF